MVRLQTEDLCNRKGVNRMYTKEEFIRDCISAFADTAGNTVDIPGTGNTVLYDIPLIGFAAADDPLFVKFLQPEIIGANFLTPAKWLPSAGTVVSFFPAFYGASPFQQQGGRDGSIS